MLTESARRYPEKDAPGFMDTTLTYAQLNGAFSKVTNVFYSTHINNLVKLVKY